MVFVKRAPPRQLPKQSRLPELETAVPGNFKLSEGAIDPLAAAASEDDKALQVKYEEFYCAGGRVVEAPSQGTEAYVRRLLCVALQ